MQRRVSRLALLIGAASVAVGIAACGSGTRHVTTAAQAPVSVTPTATAASDTPPPAGIAAIQLFHPMGQYTAYVKTKVAQLHPEISALDEALARGDTPAAERAWLTAHRTYLEIGQDDLAYGAFGDLGGAIDGNAESLRGGTANPRFTGFHKVELDLFRRHDLGAARADAAKLASLVNQLTDPTIQSDLALNAASLDAWVLRTHEILEDALRDSLSQDDNYGSNSDLDSVSADVTATREMLKVLNGLIVPRAPRLESTARRQLAAVDAAVSAAGIDREPSALPQRTRERVNGSVSVALETLAPVSELMTISNSNS